MTGPHPDARTYTQADLLLMWQVGRDFGLVEGVRLAGELVDRAVAAALERPEGHGGPDLDVAARDAAAELFRRYLLRRPS